jgi:hypothetical protein
MKVSNYIYSQVVLHVENKHSVKLIALYLQSRITPKPDLNLCEDVIINTFYTEPSNKTHKIVEILEVN